MLDLFCYPVSPHFPQLVLPPTCTHTHTHIYTHTHTHTHTHTQQGYTALMAAAESQHEDIVELLIDVHADPDLQDEVIGIIFPWKSKIQHLKSP